MLLARKEFFGYIFFDVAKGDLFIYKTSETLNFAEDFKILNPSSNKEYESSEVKLLPSKIVRDDILSGPIDVELYPTLFCNERCKFCYVGDRLSPNGIASLSRPDAERIIAQLKDSGVIGVSILGGEPLLYKDLPWLLDLLYDNGFKISLNTNGTIYNEDVIQKIIKYGVNFSISMQSHQNQINSSITQNTIALNKTLNMIDRLLSIGYVPPISIVVNKENYNGMLDTVEFLCKKGIKAIRLFHTMKSGFIVQANNGYGDIGVDFNSYKELLLKASDTAGKYGSKIIANTNFPFLIYKDIKFSTDLRLSNLLYGQNDGRRTLYIMYDGSVYGSMYEIPRNINYAGNILSESLIDIWNHSAGLNTMRSLKPLSACEICSHFEYCRGGTMINIVANNKDLKPNCPIYNVTTSE